MTEVEAKGAASYKSADGSAVSVCRFDELVSLYLDGEASESELALLSEVVRSDVRAAYAFGRACRIHIETCRMFGRGEVCLAPLPGFSAVRAPRRASRRRAAAEWSIVAAFMAMSLVMFKLSQDTISAAEDAGASAAPEFQEADLAYEVSVGRNFTVEGNTCSILKIRHRQ